MNKMHTQWTATRKIRTSQKITNNDKWQLYFKIYLNSKFSNLLRHSNWLEFSKHRTGSKVYVVTCRSYTINKRILWEQNIFFN